MKRVFFLVVVLLVLGRKGSAQSVFDLVFEQNQTQLKDMAVQIAALEGYSDVLETGYGISGSGLDSIAGIEQVDEDQHASYFASLGAVSPAVAGDPRVAGIREYNRRVSTVADAMAGLGTTLAVTVAANLKTAVAADLAALQALLTDGDLQLEDAERLKVIGVLYADARARLAFAVDAFWKMEGTKQ
jgi:hypothetical protein